MRNFHTRDARVSKGSERDIEKLYKGVLKCRPLISSEDMANLDREFAGQDFGFVRRCALAAATQSGEWFKTLGKDREMAVTMADVKAKRR